jgi:hypothetical protein
VIQLQKNLAELQEENSKIEVLSNENKKLRFLLEKKLNEIDELVTTNSQSNMNLKGFEDRLLILSGEVERLNDELLLKIKDVDNWKKNYQQLQIGVKDRDSLVEENSRMR